MPSHCQASEKGELKAIIEDSSVNGTFLNGERLPRGDKRELSHGDQIFLIIPRQEALDRYGGTSLHKNFVG